MKGVLKLKKKEKLIIGLIVMLLGIAVVLGTVLIANRNLSNDINKEIFEKMGNGGPMMNDDSNGERSTPPNGMQPPEMKEGEEPPEMPSGDMTPPNRNDKSSSDNYNNGKQKKDKYDKESFIKEENVPKLTFWYILGIILGSLISCSSLMYLCFLLRFDGITGSKNIILFGILTLILTGVISLALIYCTNHYILMPTQASNFDVNMKSFSGFNNN